MLTKSKDLSSYIRENDWYSFSGRGYLWNIGCSEDQEQSESSHGPKIDENLHFITHHQNLLSVQDPT